ncbi:MAG: ABC transporter ATP-binding protein [Syntrophobacteraceae bacterium]
MIPLVELKGVSKRFGTYFANQDVSLQIRRGEIHALVGENGAGKTTLMNMLYGRLIPDSGSILLRGKSVSFKTPRDAIRAGIGMVHQSILLFPQLSVLENVIVGFESSHFGLLVKSRARRELLRLQETFGFHLDPERIASDFPLAQRQQIELMRILLRGAELFILDEPSSLLAPGEIERLLSLLKSLRAGGTTIIFISHRLSEIFAVADRITVLRKGIVAATRETSGTSSEEIAGLMVGHTGGEGECTRQVGRTEISRGAASKPDRPVLELCSLSLGPAGTEPALKNISLSVRKGEIFGIGGVTGNGQRSLARALAGRIKAGAGSILFDGVDISGLILKQRRLRGIHWLPENPLEEALLPNRALWENFLLGRQRDREFGHSGVLQKQSIIRFAQEQVRENNVAAPGVQEPLSSLSGGNRQKVALARVLGGPARLAIIEQPSRGLDLHASGKICQRLFELSRDGKMTFIVLSFDLDELLTICDRIAILYRGEIMGTAERPAFSREQLGRWMAGIAQ